MGALLDPGQTAPAFELPSAAGGRLSLAELLGRHVVLFFFPKASTPG